MRLSSKEREHISSYFRRAVGEDGSVYLFGSRVRDDQMGGDIDLLILVKDMAMKAKFLLQKHVWIYDLQGLIGEQRIDVTVASKDEMSSDLFLKSIDPEKEILT